MTTTRVALGLVAWLATPMSKSGPRRCRLTPYANFNIRAARLLDGAKAHILLRHAKTRLHLQAVAAMLDVPCGAQVNTTLTDFQNIAGPPAALARPGLLVIPLVPCRACSTKIPMGRSFRHNSAGPHKFVTQVSPRGC